MPTRPKPFRPHQLSDRKSQFKRLRGSGLQKRNARLSQQEPLCVRCQAKGRVSVAKEWDHIIPLWKGGKDEESNLQGLCTPCHKDKTREDMGLRAKLRIGPDGWPIDDTGDQ